MSAHRVNEPHPAHGVAFAMNRRQAMLCSLTALAGDVGAQAPAQVVAVQVGDQTVRLNVEVQKAGGLRCINLHENESSSVLAARAVLADRAGSLITLQSKHTRFISFRHAGVVYRFDPNRIFTDNGIKKTLLLRGSTYSVAAHEQVRGLSKALLRTLEGEVEQTVAALHNNTPGDYSILHYRKDGPEAENARDLAIEPSRNPDDFFLATMPTLFARLRDARFNVVLQSETPIDDGSLSVWFAQQKRPYVNVEALPAHHIEQQRMLAAVADLCAAGHC